MNELFTERNVMYALRDRSKVENTKQKNTTYGMRSFTYIGAKLWNDLHPVFKCDLDDLDVDESVKTLKHSLMSWSGPKDMGYFCNYV